MANTYYQCYVHLVFAVKHRDCLICESSISISDLVRDIKSVSSKFINEQKLMRFHFNWQDGYGAFTCSHSQITSLSNYIKKQPEHHKKRTFKEEYFNFMEKFEIEFDEQYLFEWVY